MSMGRLFSFLSSLAVFSSSNGLSADPALINLSKPEILLAGWNARCLEQGDLNGDGLTDLAYFNPSNSQLELLYRCKPGEKPPRVRSVKKDRWEPVLENAPYVKERIFIRGNLTSIEIGDLNDDGIPDIVTGSPEEGISVFFREEDHRWSKPLEIQSGKLRPNSMSLKVHQGSLYLFTQEGLQKFTFSEGQPNYPGTLAREENKRAFGIELVDLNRDDFLDWIYLVPGSEYSLRVRLGEQKGFGPEKAFEVNLISFPTARMNQQSNRLSFCSIDGLSREAITFSLSVDQNLKKKPSFTEINTYDLFSESNKKMPVTHGDFNSDQISDLLLATPEKGEILFLMGKSDGTYESPIGFPSFRGISELDFIRSENEKNKKILIHSSGEKVLGVSDYQSNGEIGFPRLLPIEGEPLLSSSADLNGDGLDEILVIKEDKSDYYLESWSVERKGGFSLIDSFELKELDREPDSIFSGDLNGDMRADLLILSNREAPNILLGKKNGGWLVVGENSVVRKSFMKGISSSQLCLIPRKDSDGQDLLVTGVGLARILRWTGDDFEILKQLNAKEQKGELKAPVRMDMDGDGELEILAYHEDGYWENLSDPSGSSSKFSYRDKYFLNPESSFALSVKQKNNLVSLGTSGFQIISSSGNIGLSLEIDSSYLTDLPNIKPSGIDWCDFNNDGWNDLICLDGKRHLLEFLTFDSAQNQWESAMHFEIFEKDLHYRGKKGALFEPREGLVADLNGDQMEDLVFLIHDRLLIYYQFENKHL